MNEDINKQTISEYIKSIEDASHLSEVEAEAEAAHVRNSPTCQTLLKEE